jgi:Ni,Fe-hydrogenase III component G
MANDEAIVSELTKAFPHLTEATQLRRARRIFTSVNYSEFAALAAFLREKLEFCHLGSITGLDGGENLELIYHFARYDGTMCNVKTSVPKATPVIQSLTPFYPVAQLYERELVDLLGFVVEGLPAAGNRYPLPEDWPEGQYPLRKDWKAESLEPALSDSTKEA